MAQTSNERLEQTATESATAPNATPARGDRATVGAVVMRWMMLSRPPTLLFGIAPVALTLAVLWARSQHLMALTALSALVATALALSGANMLDEHLELERSAGQSWLWEPGGGFYAGNVLESSGLRSVDALRVSVALLLASVIVGFPAALAGGPIVFALGGIGLLLGFLYSATTLALKRLPIGELAVPLALGPGLALATDLSQQQRIAAPEVLLGVACGLFALGLLEGTHLRDLPADARTGRKTLAVVLGERWTRAIIALCIVGAFTLTLLAALTPHGAPGAALALLALPAAAIALTGALRASSASVRQIAVRKTWRAYLAFSVWATVGAIVVSVLQRQLPGLISFILGYFQQ